LPDLPDYAILPAIGFFPFFPLCGSPSHQQMDRIMLAHWSRSLFLFASLGLAAACDEVMPPPREEAPVVVAPVKKVAAPAPAPVKKKPKPVVIDFDDGGSGGGSWN
jgi:hypothetical protein